MEFGKMQALGNDYIIVNAMVNRVSEPEKLAREMCARHFGIGADGLLLVKKSEKADYRMEIYNADGSRAQMCGNGIRCFAKFLYNRALTSRTELDIETDAGIKTVWFAEENLVSVDLGSPVLEPQKIPIRSEKQLVLKEAIDIWGRTFYMTGVSMGNPHVVVHLEDIEHLQIEKYGLGFEYHLRFPERTNVEFVKVLRSDLIEMRVWERGVGETYACGTGAGAACVAGVLCGLTDEVVEVKLKRGNLYVRWDREMNHVILTGEAVPVFDGTYKEY